MSEEIEALIEIIRTKYLNIPVKLIKNDDFYTNGVITGISGNFILFRTNKGNSIESLIRLDDIKNIVPRLPPKPGEEVKQGGGQ